MIIYFTIGLVFTFIMELLLKHDNNPMNMVERFLSVIFWPVFLIMWVVNLFKSFKK